MLGSHAFNGSLYPSPALRLPIALISRTMCACIKGGATVSAVVPSRAWGRGHVDPHPPLNTRAPASPLPGSGEGVGEREERSFSSFSPLARPWERGRERRGIHWGVRVSGPGHGWGEELRSVCRGGQQEGCTKLCGRPSGTPRVHSKASRDAQGRTPGAFQGIFVGSKTHRGCVPGHRCRVKDAPRVHSRASRGGCKPLAFAGRPLSPCWRPWPTSP